MLGDVCHWEDIARVVARHFGNDGVRDRKGWEAKLGEYYCGEGQVVLRQVQGWRKQQDRETWIILRKKQYRIV